MNFGQLDAARSFAIRMIYYCDRKAHQQKHITSNFQALYAVHIQPLINNPTLFAWLHCASSHLKIWWNKWHVNNRIQITWLHTECQGSMQNRVLIVSSFALPTECTLFSRLNTQISHHCVSCVCTQKVCHVVGSMQSGVLMLSGAFAVSWCVSRWIDAEGRPSSIYLCLHLQEVRVWLDWSRIVCWWSLRPQDVCDLVTLMQNCMLMLSSFLFTHRK